MASVHLLDFGIAKLIDPARAVTETRVESRMMTPAYASPEQVKGEALGTTSDIYSLGVLLYELLCGSAPYEFPTTSPLQVATIVCEQDPPPPSARVAATDRRLAHLLDGDLDSIVLMAMRKEPARRYASADMLRQDVERHLAGLPVLAHRGSRRYRLQKFLRRHRVEAAAAAIVMVALVAGLSVAVAQGQRAAASAIAPSRRSPNRRASPTSCSSCSGPASPAIARPPSSRHWTCCSAAPFAPTICRTSRSCRRGCST